VVNSFLVVTFAIMAGGALVVREMGDAVIAAQAERKTVWDGVFTLDQSKRGKARYETACAYCHRDDLRGGGGDEPGVSPPALAGPEFLASWSDTTLAELVGTVATTMPLERPKLEPQAYVDIVSYLLQANGMPAGNAELPAEGEKLSRIAIVLKSAR
jgi:mono/diheme cytochrome c family protein